MEHYRTQKRNGAIDASMYQKGGEDENSSGESTRGGGRIENQSKCDTGAIGSLSQCGTFGAGFGGLENEASKAEFLRGALDGD